MPIHDLLIAFAIAVRADRLANPAIAGDGTALELLLAPRFKTLVENSLVELFTDPPSVLPEYRLGGVGRPDLAFAGPGQPARAFIELKEPRKSIETNQLRGHDENQFRRFSELPLWGFTNFISFHLYRRAELVDSVEIVPAAVLDPLFSAVRAETLIREQDPSGFLRVLESLALAGPPHPNDAAEVAQVIAYAARLVRAVVAARCVEGLVGVFADVRAEFNDTLFARAEAGGYDQPEGDAVFASAFAQTLVFGLLIAREAGGGVEVTDDAYHLLPQGTYPLLRGTLRALTLDEVRDALGVSFDVARDAVNSVTPDLLRPSGGRDPMLYLYEDFLRTFDPEAVGKYGVYYTPPEIVRLIVGETDRALRNGLGSDGLLDPLVRLLDPACGTGTFLIAATGHVAEAASARYGPGMVAAEVAAFAQRMYGFELLVGPYTVAHYRMLRAVANHGGDTRRLPIYLADTLAPPAGAAGVNTHLAFMGAPMVAEREAADIVKRDADILAIFGNPPYRRLRSGEIERLVGADMNQRWDDLKRPVRDAGLQRSLNAFPDLYIAFYRWALWRLFEADGATGRGVLAFITNRGFLTGPGFGGLRLMLRQRFDVIRIIDLRGNSAGGRPATIPTDENVFNIKVGVCILIAYATGHKVAGSEAIVRYADVWANRCFTRADKLSVAEAAAQNPGLLPDKLVVGQGMASMRPPGFMGTEWPGLDELLSLKSNGIVTYRDKFAYSTTRAGMQARIKRWLTLAPEEAKTEFRNTDRNNSDRARTVPINPIFIEPIAYRPLDVRHLYNHPHYVDRMRDKLQEIWGSHNVSLVAKADGTGAGPAVWCHSLKPDQHSFRGSYGGWVFPFLNHAGESRGHFLAPALVSGLSLAYGRSVKPQDAFDAILCLLSATSYTTRFAHDLENDFPHVPFPSNPETFIKATRIGARIRSLQGLGVAPAPEFGSARVSGVASGPTMEIREPRRAFFNVVNGTGNVGLLADRSLYITGVSSRAWDFTVSDYSVLYQWLKFRTGEPLGGASGSALLRGALEVVWKIEELLALFDEADAILDEAVEAPLTRADLSLPPRTLTDVLLVEEEDDAPN